MVPGRCLDSAHLHVGKKARADDRADGYEQYAPDGIIGTVQVPTDDAIVQRDDNWHGGGAYRTPHWRIRACSTGARTRDPACI